MTYITFDGSKAATAQRAKINSVIVRASSDAVVNVRDGGPSGAIAVPLAVKGGDTVCVAAHILTDGEIFVEVVSGNVQGTLVVE